MNNNKGFSIVEVVISMVIIAMLAVFVATFFAFQSKMIAEAKKVTDSVFNVQDQIEQAQKTLIDDIKNGDSSSYASKTYTVFGKNVTIDLVSSQLTNPDATVALALDTGVSSNYAAENPEPIRPKLASAYVKVGGKIKVVYFPSDSVMADVTYTKDPTTISSWYKNLYQWYVSPTRIHGIPLINFTCNNTVYPKFPWNLDIVELQNQKTMPGTDIVYPDGEFAPKVSDFKGRFLACAVTPGSPEGYMGDTYVDMVYISALPTLAQGSYKLLIDPSLIQFTLPSAFSGTTITTNNISSETPDPSLTSNIAASSNVTVNLEGANTSNNGVEGQEYYSRFITFGSVQMTFNDLSVSSGTTIGVYAVARSSANTGTPILQYKNGATTTNIISVGADSGQSIYPTFTDGQPAWYLVSGSYTMPSDSSTLKIGSPTLDLAEFIIVANPSASDDTAIKDYLLAKYGIV